MTAAGRGFRWESITVEPIAHKEGRGYCLEIRTAYKSMQVYVSEGGHKIKPMPVRDVGQCRSGGEHDWCVDWIDGLGREGLSCDFCGMTKIRRKVRSDG